MSVGARATVHLLVGLNGAGKTTHARRLEQDLPAARFSLDERMIRAHGLPYDDPAYPALAEAEQEEIWQEALLVLARGTDVVLDWNQWSRSRRAQWRERARVAGCGVVVHHVRAPLEEPSPDEGMEIRVIDAT